MSRTIFVLTNALVMLLELYIFMIIAAAMCSWFLKPYNRVMLLLRSLTEPVIYPFRALTAKLMRSSAMPIDFSPWLAILALRVLISIVQRIFYSSGLL